MNDSIDDFKMMKKSINSKLSSVWIDDFEKGYFSVWKVFTKNAIEKLDNLRDSAYGLNKDVLTLQQNIKPLLKEKKEYTAAAKTFNSFVDKAEGNIKSAFNALAKSVAELGISVNKLPVYKKYEKSLYI